jgi:hypothetical protein
MKAKQMVYVVCWDWADIWERNMLADKVFMSKKDAQQYIDKKNKTKKDMYYSMVACPLFEEQENGIK